MPRAQWPALCIKNSLFFFISFSWNENYSKIQHNQSFIAKNFWLNSAETRRSPYTEDLNLVFPHPFDELFFPEKPAYIYSLKQEMCTIHFSALIIQPVLPGLLSHHLCLKVFEDKIKPFSSQ